MTLDLLISHGIGQHRRGRKCKWAFATGTGGLRNPIIPALTKTQMRDGSEPEDDTALFKSASVVADQYI